MHAVRLEQGAQGGVIAAIAGAIAQQELELDHDGAYKGTLMSS